MSDLLGLVTISASSASSSASEVTTFSVSVAKRLGAFIELLLLESSGVALWLLLLALVGGLLLRLPLIRSVKAGLNEILTFGLCDEWLQLGGSKCVNMSSF